MNDMTVIPPMRNSHYSVMVWLFYADGSKTTGYWHKRTGWMDWGGRAVPIPTTQVEGPRPIGWRVMKEGE